MRDYGWECYSVYRLVDGVINPFAVSGKSKVIPTTKPAEVHWCSRGRVNSEWCILRVRYLIGPSSSMAMFVK